MIKTETSEIIQQELYLNLFSQIGIIKTVYYRYLNPIYFTSIVADVIYGWCGMHLEDIK